MESVKTVPFIKNTQTSSLAFNVLDVGGGDGSRARLHFPESRIITIDKKNNWDIDKRGLMNGNWYHIFANHIIEHLHYPDFFLEECRRVMQPDTILEIGTPNLAAWFNRVFFLFGYVPHSVELSVKYNVGKPFNWNNEKLGGHIYVYTVPSLIQLLKHHGFKILSVVGEASTYPASGVVKATDACLTRLSPTLASAFRVKCTL